MLDVEVDFVRDLGPFASSLCRLGEVEERRGADEEESHEESLKVGHGEELDRHSIADRRRDLGVRTGGRSICKERRFAKSYGITDFDWLQKRGR